MLHVVGSLFEYTPHELINMYSISIKNEQKE